MPASSQAVLTAKKILIRTAHQRASKDCAILVYNGAIPDIKACAKGINLMHDRVSKDYKIGPRALEIAETFSLLDCESFVKGDTFSCVSGAHAFRKVVEKGIDYEGPEFRPQMIAGRKKRRQ